MSEQSATIDFGIDLGTTNSSIALCRRGEVRVFQSTDLMNVTPSVVYISKTGRMLVGRKAYDNWVQEPQNTQAEFKRWMGFSDRLKFPASGKELSAEELSAEILKSVRADAERATQERITAAVITVPAAFGALQCDATGRAAKLAGFEQAPLLQEPIAAAIAYGATPAAAGQRWMVFDLGGGTLDIAVVSTRNGRLSVLEHQGNNRLGGKDIDRAIAEELLLPQLAAQFKLTATQSDAAGNQRLMRALLRQAEQAKISLSTAETATVELFDIGDDEDGRPIEATLHLTRADLEAKVAPIIDQCLQLARRALEGARLSGTDLDRILLVGGPTQMPVVRAALSSALGAKLDYSLDPMTVVANGAALFASTLDRTGAPVAAGAGGVSSTPQRASADSGAVRVELAYERASGTVQSPVAGVLSPPTGVHEVKIDASGGFWTSGWLPVVGGCFQCDVMLRDNKPMTTYTLVARDSTGNPVALTPAEFGITFMLPMSEAPLPHTIAIEISTTDGITRFDPVFARHTPLPAETRKTYKAERTLRPSEVDSTLPVKFWEVDVSQDAQEKWWAGCVHLRSEWLKRPILEGTELELTIKIDASRRMTVELFVPLLNESFSNNVYVPDPLKASPQLEQQLDLCFERIRRLRAHAYETDTGELASRIDDVELKAEAIAEQIATAYAHEGLDPDAELRPLESLRQIRLQLIQLEDQMGLGSGGAHKFSQNLQKWIPWWERNISIYGTGTDGREFLKLHEQLERHQKANDGRGIKWVGEQMRKLHYTVIRDQLGYWQNQLSRLSEPDMNFVNKDEAARLLVKGNEANEKKDVNALRTTCQSLFGLEAKDQVEVDREQSSESGLRMA